MQRLAHAVQGILEKETVGAHPYCSKFPGCVEKCTDNWRVKCFDTAINRDCSECEWKAQQAEYAAKQRAEEERREEEAKAYLAAAEELKQRKEEQLAKYTAGTGDSYDYGFKYT